ncbi:hypothetical protein [Streptomyces sp. NPDC093060]|uniref:hypothetical protein n=1 Tax=Streptomyces sp. NPDC093060 TaxID=3366019 RepID=UPI0038295680
MDTAVTKWFEAVRDGSGDVAALRKAPALKAADVKAFTSVVRKELEYKEHPLATELDWVMSGPFA